MPKKLECRGKGSISYQLYLSMFSASFFSYSVAWLFTLLNIDFSGQKLSSIYLFLCILEFCLHSCLFSTCMQCPRRPKEGIKSLGNNIADSCKLPFGCWESNLSSPVKCSCPLSNFCTSSLAFFLNTESYHLQIEMI